MDFSRINQFYKEKQALFLPFKQERQFGYDRIKNLRQKADGASGGSNPFASIGFTSGSMATTKALQDDQKEYLSNKQALLNRFFPEGDRNLAESVVVGFEVIRGWALKNIG